MNGTATNSNSAAASSKHPCAELLPLKAFARNHLTVTADKHALINPHDVISERKAIHQHKLLC